MIYGIDVSAYQPGFDFAAARREGFDFAIIKATEGAGWKSPNYRDQLARARAAGMIVAGYHYVRGEDVAGQLANIKSMVGVDVPVILDVEDGAGSPASVKRLLDAVRAAGYSSPLIYVPQWYWQGRWGKPDLAGWGLAGNWHSAYPNNTVARAASMGDWINRSFGYVVGGLPTVISQFTSSLAVANYPNGRIDGNAYRGTRQELQALLDGDGEDDMPSPKDLLDAQEQRLYDTDGDGQPDRSTVNIGIQGMWSAQEAAATARRIEVKLDAMREELSDDEANILAAIRAQGEGADPDRYAEVLRAQLPDAVLRALVTLLARPGEAA